MHLARQSRALEKSFNSLHTDMGREDDLPPATVYGRASQGRSFQGTSLRAGQMGQDARRATTKFRDGTGQRAFRRRAPWSPSAWTMWRGGSPRPGSSPTEGRSDDMSTFYSRLPHFEYLRPRSQITHLQCEDPAMTNPSVCDYGEYNPHDIIGP